MTPYLGHFHSETGPDELRLAETHGLAENTFALVTAEWPSCTFCSFDWRTGVL